MTSLRRVAVVCAVAGLGVAVSAAGLPAETTPVTIDSRSPTLAESDRGGWTASLGFTNLTTNAVSLTAKATDTADRGCGLALDHTQLPAAEHTAVTITVPAGCKVGKDGIDFTVSADAASPAPVSFAVTAAPKPDTKKPEWKALWAFVIALGGLALLLVIGLFLWWPPNKQLKYLEASWSFKDSWVSNVTVAGGLLAGIFGSSDVVTALLGKDAKTSVALATVGAAIAAALIAAGPLVLLATKSKDGDFVTVGGFLLGSTLTLAGAAGEIWVVYRSGAKLDLGGWEDRMVILAVAGLVLLGWYALRAVPTTIAHGTKPRPTPPPSDTIVAAQLIVAALKSHWRIDDAQLTAAIDALPEVGAAAPQAPRRRSAVL